MSLKKLAGFTKSISGKDLSVVSGTEFSIDAAKAAALISLADSARDAGNFRQAALLYNQALERESDPAIYVQAGHMNKEICQFDAAEKHYLVARRLLPDDGDLAMQLGHFYKTIGCLDDALAAYEEAAVTLTHREEADNEIRRLQSMGSRPWEVFSVTMLFDAGRSVRVLRSAVREYLDAGLLDCDFYRNRYHAEKSDAEIYEEFLRSGAYNGRSYSSNLDVIGYTISNPDIHILRESATFHYLRFGKQEGRGVRPTFKNFTNITCEGRHAVDPTASAAMRLEKNAKIAIHIHLYYADYLERFFTLFSRFPYSFDLLVSYSDKVAEADLEVFRNIKCINKIVAKRAINRGRNFAPMLVDFAQDILQYDMCCHLHSKKSLYSKRDQTGWANFQLEYLIGDPLTVKHHVSRFSDDQRLAIIAPVPFWTMGSWPNHWLKNEQSGQALADLLSMPKSEGFLCYPLGGMFWFRPARLARILQRHWNYDRFPPEEGQTDGTIQHALERCVSEVARFDGGRVLYYEPWSNCYGEDKYDVLALYKTSTKETVLDDCLRKKVISFDIFDTISYRTSLDKEIGKRAVGRYLVGLGKLDDPDQFVGIRNRAESALRERYNGFWDVGLRDVYTLLNEQLQLSFEDLEAARMLEFEADLADQRPRLAIVDIVNRLIHGGSKVVFVSDTYYDTLQIRRLLRVCGVDGNPEVFASSDVKDRKDNGRIWSHVFQKMGIRNTDIVHIGDNVVSDVQIPTELGMQALLLVSVVDKATYLMGKDLHNPNELARLGALGLEEIVTATGSNPFFLR